MIDRMVQKYIKSENDTEDKLFNDVDDSKEDTIVW
jgi:hypothetical protein